MNTNINITEEDLTHAKPNQYTVKNSALMFILALFLPYLIYFTFVLVVKVFFTDTAVAKFLLEGVGGSYISALICQLSIALGVVIVTKVQKVNLFKASNISFKKIDYKKVLLVILIGVVALFGFTCLSDLVTHVLNLIGYNVSESNVSTYGITNVGMLIVAIIVMAILPAICEEFAMRGVILGGFASKKRNSAILISSVMFMLMHLSLEQTIYQFVLGVVLSVIVWYSGNILYSIILHLFNNSLVLILNFAVPTKIIANNFIYAIDYIWPILVAIVSVVIIFFLLKLYKKLCEKSGDETLKEKYVVENNKNIKLTQNDVEIVINNNQADNRDLPSPKLEYFSSKTSLVLSLIIGSAVWVFMVILGFIL